ncbi:MAG: hypothetical protein EZS28_050301 [Streblomastix strix]|uniref:Uncharacterized protein n=1 Tax=Streblomastix strix TaxID=222440 RepID=A0A5J4T8K3_9EUKA|nr:MAG: hypothetical protein EZS28_050301 [Streblomastix strix]
MINNAPAPDVYTRPEANEMFDTKADKTDTYTKTETDSLLDDKADKTDTYTKTETDTLLDAKANVADIVDSKSKTEAISLISYNQGCVTNELTNISPPPARRIDASFLLNFDMPETLITPNYFYPVIV